ncbi:MAG TPA: UbiD family decarboxylase [Burkholderiales bacterium]|jgi:UbiD family decarboxylase|nr:UbiD family decarboxylase [Burkholderiales bacterium]
MDRTTEAGKPKRAAASGSPPKSLDTYLDLIRSDPAEFRTVSRTVNPMNFDVTGLLAQLDRRGEYPAVQFENPLNMHGEPSKFPILTNLWATRERCAEACGLPRSEAGRQLGSRFAEMVGRKREPVIVSEAPVHANVYQGGQADMWMFPGVRHFEMDLGPVFLMGLIARAPGESFYNITFTKTFPETGQRGGFTIHTPHMLRMTREWERRGERCPVVNVLGHHPGFWLGTLNNTPWGDNEYATAGGFLQESVRLVPSVTWGKDFLVPADAEIIIEGEIVPGERTIVNPFGDISRQYQAQQLAPYMEVTAITHRDNALFQDVFSGHRDHILLGSIAREGAIYNHVQSKFGNVTGVHMPFSACGRYTVYISIRKTEEGQAKQAALMALAQVPNLQVVVVVDDDIDVFNEEDVLWAVNFHVDPRRDIDLIKNVRAGADPRGLGSSRLIIDATRPTHIAFPTRLRVPEEAIARMKLEEWLDSVKGK